MNPGGIARVGLLVVSLTLSGLLVAAPGIDRSDGVISVAAARGASVLSAGSSAFAGDRGNHVQSLGCDKPRKPNCNKPGRRSTRR